MSKNKIMKQLFIFSFVALLSACNLKTSKATYENKSNDTIPKQLMIDEAVDTTFNTIPISKTYSNKYFSFNYCALHTLIEHGNNPMSLNTLYEFTIKSNESNLLYLTINNGECDYNELYNNSLNLYKDTYVTSTNLFPVSISNINGKAFNIKCKNQNITVFMIPTKFCTIVFQIFSNNKNEYDILYTIINSFELHES